MKSILKLNAVSFIAAGLIGWVTGSQAAVPRKAPRPQVKNIILFIGDGMQLEHEVAASQYLFGTQFGLVWHAADYHAQVSTWDVTTYDFYAAENNLPLYDPATFDPVVGYNAKLGGKRPWPLDMTGLDLYFLDIVLFTDSASSATAWATGYKTDDGNIAWLPGDPPDGALKTIAEYMRDQRGAAIGVVSTVPFSHATPAAHVSHNVYRNNYYEIADEILRTTKPEVVIGGGHPQWCTNKGGTAVYISPQLYSDVKNGVISDYVFVERVSGQNGAAAILQGAEAAVANGKKLCGLFGGRSDGSFEYPRPANSPGAPSITIPAQDPLLKDAVLAGLHVLSQNPNGFFVLFEQGDIDWANHSLQYGRMVGTVWGLNEAVKTAIEFVNQPGDDVDWDNTMLIVTADHGNNYMRLKRENGEPVLGMGELPQKIGVLLPDGSYFDYPPYYYADAPVYYGAYHWGEDYYLGQHTDELIRLNAWGKGINTLATKQGRWYPGTQIIDNTQIFQAMREAVGISLE